MINKKDIFRWKNQTGEQKNTFHGFVKTKKCIINLKFSNMFSLAEKRSCLSFFYFHLMMLELIVWYLDNQRRIYFGNKIIEKEYAKSLMFIDKRPCALPSTSANIISCNYWYLIYIHIRKIITNPFYFDPILDDHSDVKEHEIWKFFF